jgi:autotransporter-associated beta strand protein
MSPRATFPAFLLAAAMASAQIPSFPGAEGYGSHATGGRGGDVYIVTNRNASGAGSFADAVYTAPVAGRTIVFAVSGHIRLPSGSGGGLSISKSKITVAGQTAPGDGISFWNNTMNLTGDDLVLRHVRWRYGKSPAGGDAVDISGSQRIILDHCDVMFATDENLSSFGTPPEYFTFQWSINAWGLSGHSAGGLWDVDHATSHHSLWANNHTRNPKLIAPAVFDWANNVTFGWNNGFNMAESPTGGTGYVHRVNVRGSTFVHGDSTSEAIYGGGTNSDGSNKFKLHASDSALDGNNNGVLDVSRTSYQMVSSTTYDQVATAWPQTVDGVTGGTAIGAPVTLDPRLTAYKMVLSKVGAVRMEYDAARPLRDEITQLCVTRTAALQRGIISDPLELGLSTGSAFAALNSTTAAADADKDGMPDTWETSLGMNAAVASHNTVFPSSGGLVSGVTFLPANTPAGYTHLEEYLHFKAQPHATIPRNTAGAPSFLDIDLSRYTSGFTAGPVFTLANITGGTTSQSGTGGRIVRFTPTPDASGRAWFDFTVTDTAGSTWTQRFHLLVSANALPRDLVWVGNGTTNPWDSNSSVWSRSGEATTFNNGDLVSLDDSGSASPALALSGSLQPGAVLVDASAKDYTLTGGAFSGPMTLTKRGSGTLTLRSNHSHSGGTVIGDGALVLGLIGTTANSSGSVGGGPLTLLGDSTLTNAWFGTQLPFSAPITVPEGSEPVIHTGRNIRFSGALAGSGTLTLLNQTVPGNTFEITGSWAAFAGTLRIQHAGTNAGIRTIFNGGSFNGLSAATLDLGGGNSINPVTNSGGNTFGIGALTSTAADSILNGGTSGPPTYTVGALNTSTTFAGKLQGNARLTKTGTGTLTLTGASTHTGATAVNAGTLVVNGSFGTSPLTVAGGAILGGGGSLAGTVGLSSGAILDAVGLLGTGSLTSTDATLRFALSSTPGGTNDRVSVSGNATFSGAHVLEFAAKDGEFGPGTYPLVTTTGTLHAGAATFTHNLVNTPRQSFAIQATGNALNLVVTGAPVTLGWSGTQTQWDIATTAAWLNGAASDVFLDGDAVAFTDAASSGSVTLATAVSPRSVLVNNSTRAFTLGGAATTGGAALRKSGSGTLTLTSTNSHTGGTVIDAGTLQLGNATANAGALGSGPVTLNGGILRMFSAGNNTHAGTLPNALHVAGNARFEIPPRGGFSGSVNGSGTLEYRTNYVRGDVTGDWSAFGGQLNVTTTGSGDFRIASSYAWPGLPNASVNLAAGTYLYLSGIVNNGTGTTITIGSLGGASGSFLRGGPTGDRTLTYRIGGKNVDATFAGNISEQGSTTRTALTKTGSAVWTLAGTCGHRGATLVESGTLRLTGTADLTQTSDLTVRDGATLELRGASITAGGIHLAEGSTLVYSGGTLTGEATLGGTLLADPTGIPAGQVFTIVQNPAASPVSGIFAGRPDGSTLTSGGRTFRLSYAGGDGNDVTLTALTAQEAWRLEHFGTTQDAGNAADTFDANSDGETNLMEFATGQIPHAATRATPSLLKNGTTLEFTYTRSNAALADGLLFTVEWSGTPAAGGWSNSGVSERILSDNGTLQSVRASLAAGTAAKRFLRLRVTKTTPP